jgi:hypothetical protein
MTQTNVFRQNEFIIDTSKIYHNAYYWQNNPSVAYNGTNYYVVWMDERPWRREDIFGVMVNPQGVVIDTPGIIISISDTSQYKPRVASDGQNFFIVWSRNNIKGARVNQNGVLIDSVPIQISTAPYMQHEPRVVFDGQNYFVVWNDTRDGGTIYGARVSPAGVVIDTAGIAIAETSPPNYQSHVTFGDTNYFVVWTRGPSSTCDIYGARVTRGGVVIDTNGIPISTAPSIQSCANAAFGDGIYLVSWDDRRGGESDIYAARVQTDGVVMDPQGIPIDISAGWGSFPAIAFNGITFFVTYSSNLSSVRYIQAKRVMSSGTVIDTLPITISNNGDIWAHNAPVIFDGSQHFVVWGNRINDNDDIYGARVSIDGAVIDPNGFNISYSTTCQYGAWAGYDGSNYMVIWRERWDDDSADIRGARIAPSGSVLDPRGFSICPRPDYQFYPTLAFDGQNYLAIWNEQYQVWGARVTPAGVVLDTVGFHVSAAACTCYYPTVAYGDTNYFAVWSTPFPYSIKGSRVTTDGVSLDSFGIVITSRTYEITYPSIAYDGRNYLVTWAEDSDFFYYYVYCARVNTEGIVIDTVPIRVSTYMRQYGIPFVTFGRSNYLIVWCNSFLGGQDIYGARVDTSGVVLDSAGFQISSGSSFERSPKVALDGGVNFLVVWEEYRNRHYEIYGCRVTPAGVVIDTVSIPVFTDNYGRYKPFVASKPGQYLAVCHGFAGPPYSSERIYGILNPPVGSAEYVMSDSRNVLLRCYPIPMRRTGIVEFALDCAGDVTLDVYDVTGRRVKQFSRFKIQDSGYRKITWDGTDQNGRKLPSGVYFVRLEAGEYQETKKVLLIR